MSENTAKSEVVEAVCRLREKYRPHQPIAMKNGNTNDVVFRFDDWCKLANKKFSPAEYVLYLETVFAYAYFGHIPKGCEGSFADPNLKTNVERIMADAYYDFKKSIDDRKRSCESGSRGGKNKNKNKGNSDSTDGNISEGRLPNEFGREWEPFDRGTCVVQSPDVKRIDFHIPIRCMSTEELRTWYNRMFANQPTSNMRGNPTATDWDEIFHYLDNNDWKKGGRNILPNQLISAVKWAWQNILNNRKKEENMIKQQRGDQTPPESPGESVYKDAALVKQLADKYGLKKNG